MKELHDLEIESKRPAPGRRSLIAATCHPDRNHHAKGLCDMCYKRQLNEQKIPLCHPDRKYAHGGKCYNCARGRPVRNSRHANRGQWDNPLRLIPASSGPATPRQPLPESSSCPRCHNGLLTRYALFDRGRVLEIYCPICGRSWPLWGQEGVATHTLGFLPTPPVGSQEALG